MKIFEIPQDGLLSLKIQKEHRTKVVSVEIFKVTSKMLVLKPIIIDGKVLNPQDSAMRVELIYERGDEKPLIWKNLSYGVIKLENKPYMVLADKTDGVEYNRRTTYRMDMDVQGTLNSNERVIVHDISSTGISFYTSKDNRKLVGSPIRLKFMGGYEEIRVTGKIVREVVGEDRNMYGCTIQSSMEVDKFLSEEQRRRVMRRRRG